MLAHAAARPGTDALAPHDRRRVSDPGPAVPPDVIAWLDRHAQPADRPAMVAAIAGAVDHTGASVGPRLMRCLAVASDGDPHRLRLYLGYLRSDVRDVIVAGEYVVRDRMLVHARDLERPLGD